MIHIKKVIIQGFKTPDRVVSIEFPDTQLSVLYGKNGVGKTTFLKILQAVFDQNERILNEESIEHIEIFYKNNREEKQEQRSINIGKSNNNSNSSNFDWNELKELNTSSILFGVNRSMVLEKFELSKDTIDTFLINNQYAVDRKLISSDFSEKLYSFVKEKFQERENESSGEFDFETGIFNKKHLFLDELKIEVIKGILLKHYKYGEEGNLNEFIKVYNSYVGKDKEIVINEKEVFIRMGSIRHDLAQLSSGERHLLTFLAIFILEGKTKDLLMIDEPEMSLDTIWQRKIMDVFMKACPNSQIIVASHSPSIGYPDTDNIVKMK